MRDAIGSAHAIWLYISCLLASIFFYLYVYGGPFGWPSTATIQFFFVVYNMSMQFRQTFSDLSAHWTAGTQRPTMARLCVAANQGAC